MEKLMLRATATSLFTYQSAIETPTPMFVGTTHRVRKGTPLKRRDGNENTDVRQNSNGRAELYKDTQFAKAGYFDPFDQFVRDTGIGCCAHLRVFALGYTDKGASKRALGWMLIGRNSLSSSLVSRKISCSKSWSKNTAASLLSLE